MSLPAYPISLPAPAPGGGFAPRARLAESGLDWQTQRRPRQRDWSGTKSRHTFVYSPAQMAVWRAWWRDDLLQGARWFVQQLPGDGGMAPRTVRYLDVRQTLLSAGIYRVEASLEHRGATPWGIAFDDEFRYLVVAQSDNTDYSTPGLDDSAWGVGRGAFGSVPTEHSPQPNTIVPLQSRIWLRHHSEIAHPATLQFSLTHDNTPVLYVNGTLLTRTSTGFFTSTATCQVARGSVVVAYAVRNEPEPGVPWPVTNPIYLWLSASGGA